MRVLLDEKHVKSLGVYVWTLYEGNYRRSVEIVVPDVGRVSVHLTREDIDELSKALTDITAFLAEDPPKEQKGES